MSESKAYFSYTSPHHRSSEVLILCKKGTMTEGLGWRNCNWSRYGLEETRKRERSRRKRRQPDESFINSSPAVDCIHRILIFAFTNCRALGLTFVPHSGAASFSFLSSAFVLFMDLFTLPSILICRAFFLTLQSIFFCLRCCFCWNKWSTKRARECWRKLKSKLIVIYIVRRDLQSSSLKVS